MFPTKRDQAFDNDGMQHYYSTCPRCRAVVSDENIVFVDGYKMCRECMKARSVKPGDERTAEAPER